MPNSISTFIVDSFTDQAFKGNPAGVCLLDKAIPEKQMLQIAQELGLSETAFIQELEGPGKCSIRFFSPKMEIPLCGHATLASAKVLFHLNSFLERIHFININQLDFIIERRGEWIEMEFPAYSTQKAEASLELLEALGIEKIINCVYNQELKILLLEMEDSHQLSFLTPDFAALVRSHDSINGVLITAASEKDDFDFESRYFWPWSGTNEDPVTGGTHTFLAPYWGEKLGKTKMQSFQCSERTGFMEVELLGEERMKIRGQAQLVLRGAMML